MSKKGQSDKLIPALVIPLFIVISVVVFSSFATNTSYVFETAVINDSIGTAVAGTDQTYYSTYDAKINTSTSDTLVLYNGSWVCTNCTYHFDTFGTMTVTSGQNVEGAMKASYTALGGVDYADGYDAFDKTRVGTWSGFKLASLIPYLIIAVLIISILLGIAILR